MAAQAWHPELDEDDRRRAPQPRRKQRASAGRSILWGLVIGVALIAVVGASAWYFGFLPGARGGGAMATAAAQQQAQQPVQQQAQGTTQLAQNGQAEQPAGQQPAGPQAADPNAPTVTRQETMGDWVFTCLQFPNAAAPRCLISQQLANSDSGAPVFLWRIGQDGNGGLVSEWQTPTGLIVGRGIILDAGTEEPITIPFQACTQSGCMAMANLATDFVDSLSKATAATATVFPIGSQGVQLNLSVNGLAQGLAALRQ